MSLIQVVVLVFIGFIIAQVVTIYRSARKWNVTCDVKRNQTTVFVCKGFRRMQVESHIGYCRDKTTRPDLSYSESLAEHLAEARERANALNAIDRN